MCSVLDVDDENDLINVEKCPEKPAVCIKCKISEPMIILKQKDWYCNQCFISSSEHKLRLLLGKHRLISKNDNVLIVYNGGYSSSTMLHIIHCGFQLQQHKKLKFNPFILHIENGALLNHNIETRITSVKKVLKDLSSYTFPAFLSSFSCALRTKSQPLYSDFNKDVESYITNITDGPIKNLFDGIKSNTAKLDTYKLLLHNLVLCVAKELNCRYVFLDDLCSDIAAETLTGFATGRGSHISLAVNFIDERDANVTVLKPMRNFTNEEVEKYCQINNLVPVHLEKYSDKFDDLSSIQGVLNNFITDLQKNYPATIYSIIRTSEKLTCKLNATSTNQKCKFCQAPIEPNESNKLTALDAVAFSAKISRSENTSSDEVQDESVGNIKDILCHGCFLTLNDFEDQDVLNSGVR